MPIELFNLLAMGKYNEHRPGMYTGELFEAEARTIHMGLTSVQWAPLFTHLTTVILHHGSIRAL